MAYPLIDIDPEKFDDKIRSRVLDEYKRFKSNQLSGNDSNSKTVAQLLKEPPPKEPKTSNRNKIENEYIEQNQYLDQVPSLSREAEEEIIQRMRGNDCSVTLSDISSMDISQLIKSASVPSFSGTGVGQQQEPPQSLKMTISFNSGTSANKKSKKSKKDKKRKKKKKYRQRIESSDEESNGSDSDEDSDDPSYN